MVIDILVVLVFIVGFAIGFKKGIIKSLILVLSLILGTIAALAISPIMINLLETLFSAKHILLVITGFVLTFLIVMFLIRLLGKFVDKVFKKIKLNKLNKFSGGMLSSFFFLICLSIILWFFDQARLIPEQSKKESHTYEFIQRFPEAGKEGLKSIMPLFKNFWEKSMDAIDATSRSSEK